MPESATVVGPVGRSVSSRRGVLAGGSGQVERGWPLRLGVLTAQIGPALVDEVVAAAGATQRRVRLFSARAVVYFVLALCLFSGADAATPPGYRSVARSLTNGLRHLPNAGKIPSSPALTRARQRLGPAPLRLLFDRLRGPRATPATPGAFAFGRRLVAWDGTGIDAPDTAANAAEFGRAGGAGHPQLRLLTLLECGTHALLGAVFDGFDRASEPVLARRLLDRLEAGMLLLADRNFAGHELRGLAAATGADLIWRTKRNNVFVPVRRLPDGSFLSVMGTPAENLRHGEARRYGRLLPDPPAGHPVRIIEYAVTVDTGEQGARSEAFRLVTSLLDHEQAPAQQLAAVYHQRWEIEMRHLWCWSSRVRLSSESAFWGGCRCGRLGPAGPGVVAGWAGAAFAQPGQFGRVGMDDPERVVRHLLGGQPAAVDPVVDGGHGHAQLGGQPGHRPPIRAQAGDRGRRGAGARGADAVLVDQ